MLADEIRFERLVGAARKPCRFGEHAGLERQEIAENARERCDDVDPRTAELFERDQFGTREPAVPVEPRPRADQRHGLRQLDAFALHIVGAPQHHGEAFGVSGITVRTMPDEKLFGLPCAFCNGKCAGNAEGVEAVDIAPRRQDFGIADHIPTRRRLYVAAVESMDQGAEFVVGGELALDLRAVRIGIGFEHGVEESVALFAFDGPAEDVQPMRDQRAFQFVEAAGQIADFALFDIERFALLRDHRFERIALPGFVAGTPALDQRLEVGKPLVEARLGKRRCEVADQCRRSSALGQHPLGRIVGRVEVEIGQVADQALGPAFAAKPGLLAGHEFQGAVCPEMENGVGSEVLPDPAVEGRKGMRRREIAFEQQPHRIALVTEGRLHTDEDIAEPGTVDMDAAAVALLATRRGAPLRFDGFQMRFRADMFIGADARRDIGIRPETLGIAFQDRVLQFLDGFRHLHRISLGSEALERGMERFIHGQMRSRAGCPGIGREIEQDHCELALGPLDLAQSDQLCRLGSQGRSAFRMASHRANGPVGIVAATAEDARADRAVQFGNGNHHRRLDREKA